MLHTFTAQLWIWDARESDTWTFVTVPPEISDELRERIGPRKGFGSVPVEVAIGGSTWRTSVFPDKESGCFVLPVKAAVRKSEAISAGDSAQISLKVVQRALDGYLPVEALMSHAVDFENVSTVGLESSPVASTLAGLRANEARYFKNKYDHVFTVDPASEATETIDYVSRILKEERDIVIVARPLEATAFQVENLRMAYVFYESGLSINVMYGIDATGKRAVGFKLSEGMDVPEELASRFKFARQKSKLAGTIRGSFFVIKGEY